MSLSSFRRGNNIGLTRFVHVEYQQRRGCLVVKKCSLVVKLTAAIVPTQMNILTMAIKKQPQ